MIGFMARDTVGKHRPARRERAKTVSKSWLHFFPFESGAMLRINGPFSYDGTGVVNEVTENTWEAHIHLPPAGILGKRLPEVDVRMRITYLKEGDGNHAELAISTNGSGAQKVADTNVVIHSHDVQRRRDIRFNQPVLGEKLRLSVAYKNRGKAVLQINGREFHLERDSKNRQV